MAVMHAGPQHFAGSIGWWDQLICLFTSQGHMYPLFKHSPNFVSEIMGNLA